MKQQQDLQIAVPFGKKRVTAAVALVCSCAVTGELVQAESPISIEPRVASTVRDTTPVQLEGDDGILGGIYPRLTVGIGRQTNVFRTETGAESDTFISISPEVSWMLEPGGRHDLLVQYRADITRYNDFEDENTVSHTLEGRLGLDFTERFTGNVGYRFIQAHEARGSLGSRLFPGTEPDRYQEHAIDGTLVYGRRSNTLQLSGTVGKSWLRYRNNDQQARDRNATSVGGSVFWNLGPNTSLFASLQQVDIDYLQPVTGFNLDSKETSAHVGVRWDASAATILQVEAGSTRKNFDDPSFADASGSTWRGRIQWSPVDHSVFNFYAGRSFEETTVLDATHIVSDIYGISWDYILTNDWNLNLFAEKGKDRFSNGRQDDTTSFGGGIDYIVSYWLSAGLSYVRTERNSSLGGAGYDDELIMLTLTTDFGRGTR